jgi:hypothetical protein
MMLVYSVHPLPDTFGKIRSFPYWLIAVLPCGEQMPYRVFQVLPNGMHDFIEGILRRGIEVQVQVV